MRTEASDIAYRAPENKKKRKSKKELILEFIEWNFESIIVGVTYPEIAEKLHLSRSTAQKRCSDLFKEGKIRIEGLRDGHSIYFEDHGKTKPKLTKPEAYNMAVKTFCDLETQRAVYKFVKENT